MKNFHEIPRNVVPLNEGAVTAKQWEKVITLAFNDQKHGDTSGFDAATIKKYSGVKSVASSFVDEVSTIASESDYMWHSGDEMGTVSGIWAGRNGTFKTDMYLSSTKGSSTKKITYKHANGQIFSSEKNETIALFRSVDEHYMKSQRDPALRTLIGEIEDGFGSLLTKLSATELKNLAKNPINLVDDVMKYLEIKNMNGILKQKIREYYESSATFRKFLVFEALSGNHKFDGGLGAANYMLRGTDSGVSSLERITTALAAKYSRNVNVGVRFISHKRGRISSSFRGDIRDGFENCMKHFILNELRFITETKLQLNEFAIATLIRRLLSYLVGVIKKVVGQGISAIRKFFGLEPEEVIITGGNL